MSGGGERREGEKRGERSEERRGPDNEEERRKPPECIGPSPDWRGVPGVATVDDLALPSAPHHHVRACVRGVHNGC